MKHGIPLEMRLRISDQALLSTRDSRVITALRDYLTRIDANLCKRDSIPGYSEAQATQTRVKEMIFIDTNILIRQAIGEMEGISRGAETAGLGNDSLLIPEDFYLAESENGTLFRLRYNDPCTNPVFISDFVMNEFLHRYKNRNKDKNRPKGRYEDDQYKALSGFKRAVWTRFENTRLFTRENPGVLRQRPFKPYYHLCGLDNATELNLKFRLQDLRNDSSDFSRLCSDTITGLVTSGEPLDDHQAVWLFRALTYFVSAGTLIGLNDFNDAEIAALALSATYLFKIPVCLMSNDHYFTGMEPVRGNGTASQNQIRGQPGIFDQISDLLNYHFSQYQLPGLSQMSLAVVNNRAGIPCCHVKPGPRHLLTYCDILSGREKTREISSDTTISYSTIRVRQIHPEK